MLMVEAAFWYLNVGIRGSIILIFAEDDHRFVVEFT